MNTRLAKRIAAGCLALGVAGSLTGAGAMHAGAQSQLLVCTASGKADIAPAVTGTAFDWTISGSGSCLDVALGGSNPRTVSFTGTGTSDNLGLCSTSLLMNLNLTVTATITNTKTGVSETVSENWGLAISNFPVAVPFLINGGSSGLGTMTSHIFLSCPPNGTDSATFHWGQSFS
jgi:hypothetical protein